MIRRIGAYLSALGLLTAGALAETESTGFDDAPAQNIWTHFAFGPTQLIWLAAAVAVGAVGYLVFYRAVLPIGLHRVPEPLAPGRSRLSSAACALLVASAILGLGGIGFLWLIILIGLATVLDILGGRYWLYVIGPVMAIGLIVYGFLSH